MNQSTIAGHLGADPEVRFTSNGQKVTTLRVATKARKGGKDDTIWWKVTIWGEQFDKMMPYLKKGSPVIVTGEMSKPEIFMDREGKPQISLNITASNVMFSPFGKPESASSSNKEPYNKESGEPVHHEEVAYGQGKAAVYSDEEIPF